MVTMTDEEFVNYLVHGNEDNYEYEMKKRELNNDYRLNKPYFSSVDAEYANWKQYEKSSTHQNVQRCKSMLSKEFEVSNEDLRSTMIRNYSMSDVEYNDALSQMAASDDVDVRLGTFDKVIKIKKK